MNASLTFLGELELSHDQLQNQSFADFQKLPNVDMIRSLADEFAGQIELMPYQKDGNEMRLLVSVYLQPLGCPGKVIAVLTRAPYPASLDGLLQIVESAIERLSALEPIAHRYEKQALPNAWKQLNQLKNSIRTNLSDAS